MLEVTKDSLLKALSIIDNNPELRKKRESNTYDLVFENHRYPPILVLSEANKLLGGEELLLSDFGNSTDEPFKILRSKGFDIETKKKGSNNQRNSISHYSSMRGDV